MSRKPFEPVSADDFYGHRMDDCKNGCPDSCPAKVNADTANAAIESDKAAFDIEVREFEQKLANWQAAGDRMSAQIDALRLRLREAEKVIRSYAISFGDCFDDTCACAGDADCRKARVYVRTYLEIK